MSLTALSLSENEKLTLPAVPSSFLQIIWGDRNETEQRCQFSFSSSFSRTPVKQATVDGASLLTTGNDVKHKIELLLHTKGFECDWLPGDTIGIYPENPSSEVDKLLDLIGLRSRANCKLFLDVLADSTKKVPGHLPLTSTPFDLLTKHLSIRAPIKKLFLRALCCHTSEPVEKSRLEELSSRECSSDYTRFVSDCGLTIIDLLKSFKSCKPPLNLLLEHLPPVKPRVYSIASSPLVHPDCVRIVVTLVYKGAGDMGVCSGYLRSFLPAELEGVLPSTLEAKLEKLRIHSTSTSESDRKVNMFFRQLNNFRFPHNTNANLILVGPGSGIAPFIGFLEHLKGRNVNSYETWLFFGCRNNNDYLYRKELADYLTNGILTRLYVSFSRLDTKDNSPKYVQDSMKIVQEELINLMLKGETILMICGALDTMVKDVISALKSCVSNVRGLDEAESDKWVKDLMDKGYILTDSWL